MPRGIFVRTEEHKRNIGNALRGKKRTPEQCKNISEAKKGKLLGSANPNWKGDNVTRLSARGRTHKLYPLLPCKICGEKKNLQRHHKDNNTANNLPNNIQFLCARCHMELDGRLSKSRERFKMLGRVYQAQSVISRWGRPSI